jgi:tetratricopeptide (TPR) repeat protein
MFNIKNFRKIFGKTAFVGMLVAMTASLVFADGLPGEYYVTQRWRDLFAPFSPATNPALMTEENYVSVRGVWSPSLGNAFFLYEGGAVVPMGLYQSVGVTVLGVTSNEPIRGARWNPSTNQIEFTGDEYYDNHMMVMASYAINPFNRLSLGANLNYFKTPNFGDPIQGISLDVGATYRVAHHPVLGEHIAGINFQNAISPNFGRPEGEELKFNTQSINAKISWLARLFDRQVDAGIDFDIKDFTSLKSGFNVDGDPGDVGNYTKVVPKIEFDFSGRIGFWLLRMINVYGHFGTGFWGVSGGMNVPSIFGGRDFQAAYQYTNILDDKASFTHTIYFRGQFGPHREQVYAMKMARQVQLGPGRLYNQMLSEHFAGNFWNSFFIGGRIITEYPDFFRNDYVVYYMGMNLEGMDMRETANESFNQVISDFPRSPVVPLAQLGLLRIAYREGDFSTVSSLFEQINIAAAPDSIKQAAAYYQGLVLLSQGRNIEAISMFNTVPAGHDDFVFAQHSMAVAWAINGDMNKALEHLDNAVQSPAKTPAQRTIIERSYLLMAFIYYEGQVTEGQSLVRAMASLRAIPSSSVYRAEALLGQAWVAYRAANWVDIVASANALKNTTKDDILLSEADLLLAYKAIVDKQFANAITLLQAAQTRLLAFSPPTQSDLRVREDRYFEDRAAYFDVAQKAKELAMVNQSSYVIAQIDSLAPLQRRTENDVRAFVLFRDNFETTLFFGRGHDKVLDDVSYALAKAREMAGATGAARSQEKVQSIDEEMEKLQQMLRELEGR